MDDIKWLIGVSVTVGLTLSGFVIGAVRHLSSRISKNTSDIYIRMDEIKDRFVPKDQYDKDQNRIEAAIEDLKNTQQRHHDELLKVLKKTLKIG